MKLIQEIMRGAWSRKKVVPAFNIPYLPMMEPVVQALHDADAFGLIAVARLEWIKFQAGGLREIYQQYHRVKDESCTRLHLDHVPVIDEDGYQVDFESISSQRHRSGLSFGHDRWVAAPTAGKYPSHAKGSGIGPRRRHSGGS